MNLFRTISLLGTLALSTLAACGGGTSASSDGGADTMSTATGGSGGGTGASCDPSYKCATVASPSGDPAKLCAGTVAAAKFATLNMCSCLLACGNKCGSNLCAQTAPSTDCLTCLMDATAGCGKELMDCTAN